MGTAYTRPDRLSDAFTIAKGVKVLSHCVNYTLNKGIRFQNSD